MAPRKPEVTAQGDPVPRPDLQDVLQLLDAEAAGTAHQHLQHAVHRGQGLQGNRVSRAAPAAWGDSAAMALP